MYIIINFTVKKNPSAQPPVAIKTDVKPYPALA